jgi:dTDP-glucose 4,6-dehydratase
VDESLGVRPELGQVFPASPAVNGKASVALITHVKDRPGHDRRYAIDYRKAQRELGYAPSRDLERGLAETLEWYLSNRRWWEALLGRDYAAWITKNYRPI